MYWISKHNPNIKFCQVMQHRIQELDIDEELALARENVDYLEKKRASHQSLRKDRSADREPPRQKRWPFFCCLTVLVLTLGAMFLIYYFVTNIKDSVFREYNDKKTFLKQSLPQGKEEVKKDLEQGEALLDDTSANVDKAQDTIDGAKKIYDTGRDVYEQLK